MKEKFKAHTNPDSYNLIVSAMDTEDFPCPMPFPFKFKEGELREYYRGWEIASFPCWDALISR